MDLKCSKGCPCSDCGAEIIKCVVNSSYLAALVGMCELRDQEGRCNSIDSRAKTDEESASNEHANISGTRLQASSKGHDQTADDDAVLSANPVRKVGCNWISVSEGLLRRTSVNVLGRAQTEPTD